MPRPTGYGSSYKALNLPFDGAREMVVHSAMHMRLHENVHDQMALASHDMGQLLGSRRNGTLRMRSDNITKQMGIGFAARGDR